MYCSATDIRCRHMVMLSLARRRSLLVVRHTILVVIQKPYRRHTLVIIAIIGWRWCFIIGINWLRYAVRHSIVIAMRTDEPFANEVCWHTGVVVTGHGFTDAGGRHLLVTAHPNAICRRCSPGGCCRLAGLKCESHIMRPYCHICRCHCCCYVRHRAANPLTRRLAVINAIHRHCWSAGAVTSGRRY